MRPTEYSKVRASQLGSEPVCFALAFGGGPDVNQAELESKVHAIVSDAVFIRTTPYGPIFGLSSEADLLVLARSGPLTLHSGHMIGFCPPVEFEGIAQYATPYRQISVYRGSGEVVLYVVNIVIFSFFVGAIVNGTKLVRHIAIALGCMLGVLFLFYMLIVMGKLFIQRQYMRF